MTNINLNFLFSLVWNIYSWYICKFHVSFHKILKVSMFHFYPYICLLSISWPNYECAIVWYVFRVVVLDGVGDMVVEIIIALVVHITLSIYRWRWGLPNPSSMNLSMVGQPEPNPSSMNLSTVGIQELWNPSHTCV